MSEPCLQRSEERARIVGIGRHLAGDDAVGLAVIEKLRTMSDRLPPGVKLIEAEDGAILVEWLDTDARVIVVDAVVGEGAPGEVVELDADRIGLTGDRPLSTHGLGIADAVALARVLHGRNATRVAIVGVRIQEPTRGSSGLSREVQAGVPRAAEAVLARLLQA